MAKTNVHDFISELDAGIFETKLATALSDVALGVLNHDKQGTVKLEFTLKKMDSDNPQVQIQHKLSYVKPTKRGKSSESQQPTTRDYLVYESPEEIISLINFEDVPILINFDDLGFTVRTGNVLKSAGIDTVDKLVTSTEIDLMRIPRGGKKFINEVKEKLAKRGLSLVTNI